MSYCSLSDLKAYLGVTASTDDALLQIALDAATARIDTRTGRTFQAASDVTNYYDPSLDIEDGELRLGDDFSYISSVTNGDGADITQYIYRNPRNKTPYHSIGIKSTAPTYWAWVDDIQDSITITGRRAYLHTGNITVISRSNNVVTATVVAPAVSVGQTVWVAGCADTSFNGTFTVTANNGSSITWAQTAGNDTDTTATLLFTPVDIVQACRRLAAWLYRQKDNQNGDADRPLLAGDGSVIMPTTLPADVEYLLNPYIKSI